jgi:hypothetical protein
MLALAHPRYPRYSQGMNSFVGQIVAVAAVAAGRAWAEEGTPLS